MGYDEWDEAYTHGARGLPWELGFPRPQLVRLIESGVVRPGTALDICCGAGTNTIYLAKNGFDVTGIDISKQAVEIAKKKAEDEGVKIRWDVGSVLDLPYMDMEFDFIFDMGCFHHILEKDRLGFINEIRRVLKKKGVYYMTCFSRQNGPAWNHFKERELREIFSPFFNIRGVEHNPSLEGDGVIRYFYSLLMEK